MNTWTTPKTFVANEVATAGEMNTYLSDNTEYLKDEVDALNEKIAVKLTVSETEPQNPEVNDLWVDIS
jgi:hypothetical protein